MNHIIAASLFASKLFNIVGKGWQILVEIVFVNWGQWSCFDMDDADLWAELDDLGSSFVAPTGKDINGDVARAQFLGQLTHIYIHAASVFCTSWCIERGRVHAEHSD